MSYRTVADVFEKPDGPVRLDPSGRWWISRAGLGIDDDEVEVWIGDGDHVARIKATPETLRGLAAAIAAQVDGAEANTPRLAACPSCGAEWVGTGRAHRRGCTLFAGQDDVPTSAAFDGGVDPRSAL